MLSSISWQQYFVTLMIATLLYYLLVWIVFFKAKLSLPTGISFIRQYNLHGEDQPDEVITTAQHVMDEVRPLIHGYQNKNELIQALQLKLKKYNQWDEPDFRDTINDFIANECESKCSIRLSEDDLRAVWSG